MEINKSILLCLLFLLPVVAKETRIKANGTEADKDNTCIQQGNLEIEGTLNDYNLYNPDQITDEDEENMNRSLFGFDQFDYSELKTNDAGQPRHSETSYVGQPRYPETSYVGQPRYPETSYVGQPRYPETSYVGQPRYPETSYVGQPRYPETSYVGQPRYPEEADTVLPTYEYPPLTRRDPGKIGDTQEVEYSPGKVLKLITRAVQPPIFEVPEFLTTEECDNIIKLANNVGLKRSRVKGINIDEEFKTKNIADVFRVSDQVVLKMAELGDLELLVIERSEGLQVVSYEEGGHFHAHLDSSRTYASHEEEEDPSHIPCCFQMNNCSHVADTPNWKTCCRMCRYITVMYYLSDVPAGGETAFPLADIPEDRCQATFKEKFLWYNPSYYCHNASFILRPKKGTAIMWYNHHVDPETGYLGLIDNRSYQ